MSQTQINMSDLIYIDEEGLLPGTDEPTQTSGYLNFPPEAAHASITFAALPDQDSLNQLGLKSKGTDLSYSLSENDQLLTATIGKNGPVAFTVQLENDGSFTFSLHHAIDRQSPHNLVKDEWIIQETHTTLLQQNAQKELAVSSNVFQEIPTKPDTAYQVSFYYHAKPDAFSEDASPIRLYWGDQLLHEFNAHQSAKGFIFTVDGDPNQAATKLQIVGTHAESFFQECLDQISLISTAQNKLPLDFAILTHDEKNSDDSSFFGYFTVNVTTTPPIQVNNQDPYDIVYDQATYQTIIIQDKNVHDSPMTTINLDSLFKNLDIPHENRYVEIVQREENGLATNVYEVKISDKSHAYEPITVADVQLSFPGGDGGLAVFLKNVLIDEGKSDGLPAIDPHNFEHLI